GVATNSGNLPMSQAGVPALLPHPQQTRAPSAHKLFSGRGRVIGLALMIDDVDQVPHGETYVDQVQSPFRQHLFVDYHIANDVRGTLSVGIAVDGDGQI